MRVVRVFVLAAAALAAVAVGVAANEGYVNVIPNGGNVMCPPNGQGCNGGLCRGFGHDDGNGIPACQGGTSSRNPFGNDFASEGASFTTALCTADSDSDGEYNGQELGDPCCTGQTRRSTMISHPGYANSVSGTASCNVAASASPSAVTVVSQGATTATLSITASDCVCSFDFSAAGGFSYSSTSNPRPWEATQLVAGLAPATTHTLTVTSANLAGPGGSDTVQVTTTAATVPDPVTNAAADTKGTDCVGIRWVAPIETGDATTLTYDIVGIDVDSSCSATATECEICGLDAATGYAGQIYAVNGVGRSTPVDIEFDTPSAASVVRPSLLGVPLQW